MLMRARSIRLSIHPNNELPFNWEAALRTVFGPFFATDTYKLPSQLAGSAAASLNLLPCLACAKTVNGITVRR